MTSEGHIYKIICTLDEKFCYIGSTFNRLSKRFEFHIKNYHQWKKGTPKTFCSCFPYFDKYGVDKFKIILIKSYEVCRTHNKDRRHLEAYETLWINKSKCVNKILPICYLRKEKGKQYREQNKDKIKEYYEKNKDKILEYDKEYRQKNKDKLSEKAKEYHEKNKDKKAEQNKEYHEKNKDKIAKRKKEYREANKDKIKEYREANKDKLKEYREANKDRFSEKAKVKVSCPHCDKEMTKGSLTRHINKYCKNK